MEYFLKNKALAIAGILGIVFLVVLFFALGGQKEGNPEDVTGGKAGTANLPGLDWPAANNQNQVSPQPQANTSGGAEQTIQLPENWTPDKFSMRDVVVGTGPEAKKGSKISVHYTGVLTTGQAFDSSRPRGEPFELTLGAGEVIKGWDDGLVGMKVGGKRVLVIPPALGYGGQTVGPIPPNSTLIFEVELLGVK